MIVLSTLLNAVEDEYSVAIAQEFINEATVLTARALIKRFIEVLKLSFLEHTVAS